MDTKTRAYALIWFEGENYYTLVDQFNKTVLISEAEAYYDTTGILKTEDDVENAADDVRYAISTDLLEDLFGWTV